VTLTESNNPAQAVDAESYLPQQAHVENLA